MSATRTPRPTRGLAGVMLGLLLALPLTGCAGGADDRPLVVVSTAILGDVVGEVVGDEAQVLTLMAPEADPHSSEISTQEAARLRSADLVVSNGLGLEEGLQQHLDAAADDGVPQVVAGEHVEVLDYAQGDAAGTPDPHLWTDPARMVDVVEALTTALGQVEGIDDEAVRSRADAYVEQLRDVDAEMEATFAAIPEERRALVSDHHVFGYLAERYDFDVVGALIPGGTTLAAPSTSDLADLVDAVERTQVRAIFTESSAPDRLAQALADEAGVEVAVVGLHTESLTAPGGGAEDYLSMMRANAHRIAQGLG